MRLETEHQSRTARGPSEEKTAQIERFFRDSSFTFGDMKTVVRISPRMPIGRLTKKIQRHDA